MKKTVFALALVICFATFNSFTISNSAKDGKVNWISMSQAIELAQKEPRKIIVDVYADWCGWCKKMDKTTYSHPAIADYLNEKYYAVKFDAESKEPITVGAETFRYKQTGRGGVHELAQTLLEGQISLPSAVVLDEKLSKLTIIPGYQDVEMMDKALHYFGDGYYDKGIKWGVFEKNYRPRIKN
ncbi:DUF255 domain-containing protein [Sphingobacteriales bacterium UPWRP_1]|nr:hypothetical protein BVG80_08350 [Sphingobacteriales bacterium TSM_CSM]PSJ76150.1 DUF255 domain-containing protein [Sphingobacteriales bacterium UPWRP_1]